MATERRADVVWEGDLLHGSGTVVSNTSGALPQLPVSWASRAEAPNGKTSPEELIAAAHASCFAMALSHELAQVGILTRRGEVVPRRPPLARKLHGRLELLQAAPDLGRLPVVVVDGRVGHPLLRLRVVALELVDERVEVLRHGADRVSGCAAHFISNSFGT